MWAISLRHFILPHSYRAVTIFLMLVILLSTSENTLCKVSSLCDRFCKSYANLSYLVFYDDGTTTLFLHLYNAVRSDLMLNYNFSTYDLVLCKVTSLCDMFFNTYANISSCLFPSSYRNLNHVQQQSRESKS